MPPSPSAILSLILTEADPVTHLEYTAVIVKMKQCLENTSLIQHGWKRWHIKIGFLKTPWMCIVSVVKVIAILLKKKKKCLNDTSGIVLENKK